MSGPGFGMHRHDEIVDGDKIIEALLTAAGVRTKEQEDSMELHFARDYVNQRRREGARFGETSDFLWLFFSAFLNTDPEHFDILRPTVQMLIAKHDLKCTCEKEETKDAPA